MAHEVKILRAGASLPDGHVYYVVDEVVTLTDDQFDQITPESFSAGWLEDLGAVSEPGEALDPDLEAIAALTPASNAVLQANGTTWVTKTPAQLKTTLALAKADVGLSAVDNTTDLLKPLSTATTTALAGKAATSHTHVAANITDVSLGAVSGLQAVLNALDARITTLEGGA